jgi:hypothetical protein
MLEHCSFFQKKKWKQPKENKNNKNTKNRVFVIERQGIKEMPKIWEENRHKKNGQKKRIIEMKDV